MSGIYHEAGGGDVRTSARPVRAHNRSTNNTGAFAGDDGPTGRQWHPVPSCSLEVEVLWVRIGLPSVDDLGEERIDVVPIVGGEVPQLNCHFVGLHVQGPTNVLEQRWHPATQSSTSRAGAPMGRRRVRGGHLPRLSDATPGISAPEVPAAPPADLAVVVVNYNAGEYLARCVTSVVEASGGLAVDLLVVDNASRDGSARLAAQRLRQVRLIDNPTNRGLSASPLRRCKLPGLPVMVSQVPKSAHFYSSVRVPSNTTCSRSSPRSASTPGCSSTEHSPSNLNVARQGPRWLFTGREARSFWAMEAVGSRAGPLPNRPRRPSTPRSHECCAKPSSGPLRS